MQGTELKDKSQQLMDGPLKHIRGAALAAALLPLASIAAAPASAQSTCPTSGGVCGFVFNDTNGNGIQDAGETGIQGVKVTVFDENGTEVATVETGPGGIYSVYTEDGTFTVSVQKPVGTSPSPADQGSDDTIDSDGIDDGSGNSVATGVVVVLENVNTDFGFVTNGALNPGTGTPGYWKNHPDAWPTDTIKIGGIDYTKAQAISWLNKVGKDKTTTMFSSLVPAILNVMIGNDGSCIQSTIDQAQIWMATYGPVGSGVSASSPAWVIGEPLHQKMDAYNNGLSCAPHRK